MTIPVRKFGSDLPVLNGRTIVNIDSFRQFKYSIETHAHASTTDSRTLVHESRERHLPPLTDSTKSLAVGNAHVSEIHFVKIRPSRNLFNRLDLHTRGFHIKKEIR